MNVLEKSLPELKLVVTSAGAVEPIRWTRVRSARARIASGYYDRADVLDRLATTVLEEIDRR